MFQALGFFAFKDSGVAARFYANIRLLAANMCLLALRRIITRRKNPRKPP